VRFDRDPETGFLLPRARSLERPRAHPSMLFQYQQGQAGRSQASAAATVAEAVSLYAARRTFWEFEENGAGSAWVNAVTPGTYDLTVRKTSGTDTTSAQTTSSGQPGRGWFPNNAAGNASYLPTASGFRFTNTDQTFGLWLRSLTTIGGSARFIMGDVGSGATTYAMLLKLDAVDAQYHFAATSNGSTATDIDSAYNPHGTDWTLLMGGLDRTNNQTFIKVRRVGQALSTVTAAFASALYTGASSGNFALNCGLSSDTTYFSGSRDCIGTCGQAFVFNKVINDNEFDYLYNAGVGRTWAALATDAGH
jgi:hypothetical protein